MPKRGFCSLILLSLAVVTSPRPLQAAVAGGIRAVTRPSADIMLSFVQPGRIVFLPLKEGDAVKADQILVRQDDAAEQIQLAQLKAQAEDTTQIQAAVRRAIDRVGPAGPGIGLRVGIERKQDLAAAIMRIA